MPILSPVPTSSSDRVLFAGDSITALLLGRCWFQALVRSVDANWTRPSASTVGVRVARPDGYTLPPGRQWVVMDSAVGGQVIADLVTNFTAQFAAFNPTLIFINIGSNDADGSAAGGTPTAIGAFTASLNSLVTLLQTNFPSARVVFLTILCIGEVWTSGAPNTWGPNAGGHDALIDQMNGAISTACAAAGYGFVDTRAAGLVAEVTGNPTKAASGYLTVFTDGKHLTDAGKQLLCDTAYAQLAVQP